MKLSDLDRREFCPKHGWVGRRAFQQDRHDLCDDPDGAVPAQDDNDEVDALDDELAEETGEETEEAEVDNAEPAESPRTPPEESERWSRAAARRKGIPSKKTLAVRRITQLELATGRAELQAIGADGPYERPKTRGDCQWCPVCQLVRDGKSNGLDDAALRALGGSPVRSGEGRFACGHRVGEYVYRSRPCVFISCKQSLYLDVSETGSIILNFPHLEPGEMSPHQSCALDLSDRGSMTLEDIAVVTNLTRERIRQIELKALLRRARPAAIAMGLGPDDAAAIGARHNVGPGADLEEQGVEGAVPSDVATLLISGGGGSSGDDS